MATITRENIGLLNEKIIVKVETADYLPSFEKAMKTYSKQANIPGFRKGMVPVGMVKKMYGSSVFADEVIKSVEKGLSDYMANEKLEIFAQPLPLPENDPSKLDMNQPSEYAFAFEVGLKPDFTLPDLGQAQLKRYIVQVTDEMINNEINSLQERFATDADMEEISSEDDIVTLDFYELDPEGHVAEGSIAIGITIGLRDFSPSYRENLIGKKIDDLIVARLTEAFEEKDLPRIMKMLNLENEPQHAEKNYEIHIGNVKILEKPGIDEDFFSQVYPTKSIHSEEDFRNEIRQDLKKQWESRSRGQLLDQIYHELLDHSIIEFPEDFLKRWMVTSAEKPKTPEQVEQEFPTFVNQLKWTLILDKVVRENDIEVKPGDIIEFAKQQLVQYMAGNIDLDQPWVNEYINKMMKDKKYVEDSYHRIQTDKVFLWAESQVHPVDTEISAEDFTHLLENHHH